MDKSNNVFIRSRQKTMQKMINDTIVPISLRKRRIKKILFGQLEPFFLHLLCRTYEHFYKPNQLIRSL